MAYCQAIQAGEGFKSHCAGNSSGAVHSAFRRAVNLRMEDALICIATPDVGGAYHCLNVAEKDISFFVPGQPVRFSSEGVTVGGIYISLQNVPLYRSPLSPSLRGTASGPMILRFKQIMDRKAPRAGVHTGREPELLCLLHTTELAAAAARLIGLGPGLTPAGDDILLGYLVIYAHMGGDEKQLSALRDAVLKNLPRTGDISAQMLHDAVLGHYPERAAAVTAALCRGELESLDVLLSRLMETGASSGSDMAAGMYAALCACEMEALPPSDQLNRRERKLLRTTLIRHNLYSDSVSLMRMGNQAKALPGVADVLVGMATELNKELLEAMGCMTEDAMKAGPNDLLIGILAQAEEALHSAVEEVDALLQNKKRASGKEKQGAIYETISDAVEQGEGYNLAVISVPGAYAARECRIALQNGLNVFLFSDNVSVEDEIRLKQLANERRLFLMGPDCGTAILNGVPLGFANAVRKGNIGIAAASGTGLQHVTALLHHMGAGISQAIGTGGRDLSAKVGGRTMLFALDALAEDEETKVVMILSKPPAPEVAEAVLEKAKGMQKPVVLCLFGRELKGDLGDITLCADMEQAAATAAQLSLGHPVELNDSHFNRAPVEAFQKQRRPEQRYVRGIFGGGTVCDEAMVTFRIRGIPICSNIPLSKEEALLDIHRSEGNTFLDMGDDYFTRGKPHPMIEPSLRNKRIVADALLPDTAVMLLDVELGYGCHPDPAGVLLEAVREAKSKLQGRELLWIASVIGTPGDPQGYEEQMQKLADAGFVVTLSNVRAASLAASVVQEGGAL